MLNSETKKIFNPNEVILERVRSVEEYNIETDELEGRYTNIEDPSLQFSANGTTVTDATGAEVVTFYNAQTGTFDFTNSFHALDLMASQFGTKKEIGSEDNKILTPVSETIAIKDGKVVLKYVPVGVAGAEVKYVKVINSSNEFGDKYEVAATAADGKFTIDAASKTITLPEGVTGKVFVKYEKESVNAVRVTKTTDGVPEVKKLLIHAIFHEKCNTNRVIAGVIQVDRAQINPESVELNLTADGKHSASYKLQKNPCDDSAKLAEVILYED